MSESPPKDGQTSSEPRSQELARRLADHKDEFIAFAERRMQQRAAAEDLVQEAFARALERIDALQDDDAVVAWFYRSLRNAIIDHFRRQATASRALETLATEMDAQIEVIEMRSIRVCRCVLDVARGLKAEYAEALQRIELDGAGVKAFAEERGISSTHAAVRVFRARNALRRGVIATCGACAEAGCRDCTCGQAPSGSAGAPGSGCAH